ncbi:hypothetical protein [Fibrella arboris]
MEKLMAQMESGQRPATTPPGATTTGSGTTPPPAAAPPRNPFARPPSS